MHLEAQSLLYVGQIPRVSKYDKSILRLRILHRAMAEELAMCLAVSMG